MVVPAEATLRILCGDRGLTLPRARPGTPAAFQLTGLRSALVFDNCSISLQPPTPATPASLGAAAAVAPPLQLVHGHAGASVMFRSSVITLAGAVRYPCPGTHALVPMPLCACPAALVLLSYLKATPPTPRGALPQRPRQCCRSRPPLTGIYGITHLPTPSKRSSC